MSNQPTEQMEFPSLAFPDRTALRPEEVASRIGCTTEHIYDLCEEGVIIAIDISGRNNLTNRRTLRIPVEAWDKFIKDRRLDSEDLK